MGQRRECGAGLSEELLVRLLFLLVGWLAPMPPLESAAVTEAPDTYIEANECTRFAAQLPAVYDVYVAGASEGRPLDAGISSSRGVSDMFDVAVHSPDRAVVLVLAADKAALWMVRPTPETNIAGVWLAGDSRHQVIGIPGSTLVMKGADAQRDCGSFFVTDRNSSEVRGIVRKVFGREPKPQVVATNGDVSIGRSPTPIQEPRAPLAENDSASSGASYAAPGPSLAGDRGIQQLLRQGKLKAATLADYKRYVRDQPQLSGAPDGRFLWRTYLVTAPITFPADLHGAHRAVFILLPGVPHPEGDPGHSEVIRGQ
jgi:hypothetical protein